MADEDLLEIALAIQNIALLSNDETIKKIKPKLNCIEEIVLKWQKEFKNQKSLQAELEAIKAEIDDLKCYTMEAEFRDKVFDVIDKHIEELNNE